MQQKKTLTGTPDVERRITVERTARKVEALDYEVAQIEALTRTTAVHILNQNGVFIAPLHGKKRGGE